MYFKALPTQERLKELLEYNPQTGIFTRKITSSNAKKGSIAGGMNSSGYNVISIDSKHYRAHRLAWMYVYGEDPSSFIVDHINRDQLDNRINNLRLVSPLQSSANTGKHSDRISNLPKGVYQQKSGNYQAQIHCRGKRHYLGTFASIEEAAKAYQRKADELHGAFASH